MWYEPRVASDGSSVPVDVLHWDDFVDVLTSPVRRADLGGPSGGIVVVRDAPEAIGAPEALLGAELTEAARALPVVIVLDRPNHESTPATAVADVAATGVDLDLLLERVTTNPQAATALALLLRGGRTRSVVDGLIAESAVYSTLQGGNEFRRWRAEHPRRERGAATTPAVRVSSAAGTLDIVLSRPEVRNALDARMRDELWDAFLVAAADPDLAVRWSADGPSFCGGGDLDEFGSVPDPATGHIVRLTRSLGLAIHQLAGRTTVHVHGACTGSGIELPAFARRIVAAPDSTFCLPELGLGLIPGAGGTVSLPIRIGRHRTAWLALTGRAIDADTALGWGLVDAIDRP